MTWKFASSSGSAEYTTTLATDGKLLCNCKGWTMRKVGKPRECKHTRDVVGAQQLRTETRGEFLYAVGVVGAAAPAPAPAPAAPKAPGGGVSVHRVGTATAPSQSLADRAQKAAPMLASAMTDPVFGAAFDARYAAGWTMEQKINGHRCVCVIEGGVVTAFSRPKDGPAKVRVLPPHIHKQLAAFPDCIPDGELVASSGQSWDVPSGGSDMVYVIFDLLSYRGDNLMGQTYEARRTALLRILAKLPKGQQAISTVESVTPSWAAVEAIWAAGGEGAVVKRLSSTYRAGYRSPEWVKVKRFLAATLVITGFEAGKNGPYSKLQLRDGEGRETTCKTPTNKMLREAAANPKAFLQRRVVIRFPGWTPKGYGGPVIFDHFAGVGE